MNGIAKFNDAFASQSGASPSENGLRYNRLSESLASEAKAVSEGTAASLAQDALPPVTAQLLDGLEYVVASVRSLAGYLSVIDEGSIEQNPGKYGVLNYAYLSIYMQYFAIRYSRGSANEIHLTDHIADMAGYLM